MKYILSFVGVCIICCGLFLCGNLGKNKEVLSDDYIRIHITANSNSTTDQNIKYSVKDAVVDFLIPKLAFAQNKDEATEVVLSNILNIQHVANDVLLAHGVRYNANISVMQEEIPTRVYDDLVLEQGVYETLKIDLGQAKGDNWWCVVFPAVCFISSKNSENYVYISKIWDIINNVTSNFTR